jgi:hypothetical protein
MIEDINYALHKTMLCFWNIQILLNSEYLMSFLQRDQFGIQFIKPWKKSSNYNHIVTC